MFRGQASDPEDRKPRVQLAHRRVLTTRRFSGGEPQEDRKAHEKPGWIALFNGQSGTVMTFWSVYVLVVGFVV